MIVSVALEFDDEAALRAAVDRLWNKNGITGEIEIQRLENGRWRLDVHSEKPLRPNTLESLGGRQVKARSAVTKI